MLGLTWSDVNLETGELHIRHQLQRVRRRLLHTDTAKTEASEAVLPLPDICLTALRLRQKEQQAAKERAEDLWTESDMVFTTRYGTPVEPRNFTREFDRRCERAASAVSACTTPATPAPRFWPRSTSTRGSRCRSFATPRSR